MDQERVNELYNDIVQFRGGLGKDLFVDLASKMTEQEFDKFEDSVTIAIDTGNQSLLSSILVSM